MSETSPDHGIDKLVSGLVGVQSALDEFHRLAGKHNKDGVHTREEDRFKYTVWPANRSTKLKATRAGFNGNGDPITIERPVTQKRPFEAVRLQSDSSDSSTSPRLEFWRAEPPSPDDDDYNFFKSKVGKDGPFEHLWVLSIGIEDQAGIEILQTRLDGQEVARHVGAQAVSHAVRPVAHEPPLMAEL